MATAKTPRARGVAVDNGGEMKLEESLSLFTSDKFNADTYVQSKCSLNEKEIRHLHSYLLDLKKASAEEMRRSVYANYAAFIRTSKEISDLEGELSSMRNLLSIQATLVHGLADGACHSASSGKMLDLATSDYVDAKDGKFSEMEKWAVEFPDQFDVLLAERRIGEALAAIDEGERTASNSRENGSLTIDAIRSFQSAITESRKKLADLLAETACHASTRGLELRSFISAIKELGDGPRAHALLLDAHSLRFKHSMRNLRPSGSLPGAAYMAALSQLVFSAVAHAASDSLAVFGNEPAYASELVMWATGKTEAFALLAERHALASSAAAGGLRSAAECVQIALGHCSLLEAHGLALCPVLLRLFRPSVEQALDAHLKRIEESTAALAAADDWEPLPPHRLTKSALRFSTMVQDFAEDAEPLASMNLGDRMLECLFRVFDSYVGMLVKALPSSTEEAGFGQKFARVAETDAQQLALLANASLLADELLPRAASRLSSLRHLSGGDDPLARPLDRCRFPELREWRKRLVGSVDMLKDAFCRQHALDLIFNDDDGGDGSLSANTYMSLDEVVEMVEWLPSPLFQELFLKLNRLANMAVDMFIGRGRFATLLLMRLTETVMLWLLDDEGFWDEVEEGPRTLGPQGLLQFCLDMKFVLSFASQGRYLSRNLHRVVQEIIEKAVSAFSATGIDPESVLPEQEWFNEVCQEAMGRLCGKPKAIDGEREVNSPTARSISSNRSHGSS